MMHGNSNIKYNKSVVGNVQGTLGVETSGNLPDFALNLQSPF